jgi:hypothetical protein
VNEKRFNELLYGRIHCPKIGSTIVRLMMALRAIVGATGEAGERAMEEYCATLERRDKETDQ